MLVQYVILNVILIIEVIGRYSMNLDLKVKKFDIVSINNIQLKQCLNFLSLSHKITYVLLLLYLYLRILLKNIYFIIKQKLLIFFFKLFLRKHFF